MSRPATARHHQPTKPPVPRLATGSLSARRATSATAKQSHMRGASSDEDGGGATDEDHNDAAGSGSSTRRFVSDRNLQLDSIRASLRASKARYSEFIPPPSPFDVEDVPRSRPISAAVQTLYDLVDGRTPSQASAHVTQLHALVDAHRTPPHHPPATASATHIRNRSIDSEGMHSFDRPHSSVSFGVSRPASAVSNSIDMTARHQSHRSMSNQLADGSVRAIVEGAHDDHRNGESKVNESPDGATATASEVGDGDGDGEEIELDRWGVPVIKVRKTIWGNEHRREDLTLEERRQLEAMEAAQMAEAASPSPDDSARAGGVASRAFDAPSSLPLDPSVVGPRSHSARPSTAKRHPTRPTSQQHYHQHRPHHHRPLYDTRPISANGIVIDQPTPQRNRLWAKYALDTEHESQRLSRLSNEPSALDLALHLKSRPHGLHDPLSNHALQGMKLVSEERIAELENQPTPMSVLGNDDEQHHHPTHSDRIERPPSTAIDNLSSDDESDLVDTYSLDHIDDLVEDLVRRGEDAGMARRRLEREEAEQLEEQQHQQQQQQRSYFQSSHTPIDFARVGIEVAARLKEQGFPLSQSHLDLLHSLPLLERVWLAAHSRGFGLNEIEFVDFLSGASHVNKPTLSVLFEKMDINSESRLSWDEYLSYLVRELACKWRMSAGAGTYIVTEDDNKSGTIQSDTATVITQLLILPQVGNPLFPTSTGKIVARCKNDTVQVFDTNTLQYLYHIPIHAPVKKRKKIWTYEDDIKQKDIASEPGATGAGGVTNPTHTGATLHGYAGHPPPSDEKMFLYNVDNVYARNQALRASSTPSSRTALVDDDRQVDPGILSKLSQVGWRGSAMRHRSVDSTIPDSVVEESDETTEEIDKIDNSDTNDRRREEQDDNDYADRPLSSSRRPSTGGTGGTIRHVPKSPSGGRPMSAAGTASSVAGEPTKAKPKKRYEGIRDRKLEVYLAAVELISSVPVAQPLSIVSSRHRASGRPPPTERPATAGGVMHRDLLELQARNRPYTFPITAIAHLPTTKQVVVSAGDRSLRFFGLVRRSFELQDLFYVHESPQCIEVDTLTPGTFSGMHGQVDRTLAIIGTVSGSITAYNPTTHARVANLSSVHSQQPVKKVQLFPQVGLITAGMDGRLAIIDPCTFQTTRFLGQVVDTASGGGGGGGMDLTTTTTTTRLGHNSGVFSFALCPLNRTLLSVGFDREVFCWDPHMSTPTWKLPTQNSDLLDVLVNESKNQILLVSRDQKVRVFDTRNFKQIQETLDTTEYFPAGKLSACMFDTQKQELLTAANKISLWKVEPSMSNKAALASAHAAGTDIVDSKSVGGGGGIVVGSQSQKAHISTIVAVLYSWSFNQIVTVCENESIRVWDVFNGCKGPNFEFNTTHKAQVTAASLDWNGKRLLTACHHGRILLWNFNNGEQLYEFALWGGGKLEVNHICLLSTISQCLVAIGWSKNVLRWPAPQTSSGGSSKSSQAQLVTEQVAHRAQILSLATFGNFIVTGDADGELVSWVADSGQKLHSLILPKTSHVHRVHRDEANWKVANETGVAPPIRRETCAPAITCLEFFLVHDLNSYDSWHKTGHGINANESHGRRSYASGAPSPTSYVHNPNPPDYRQQHAHIHRVALFCGTDDGSVYVISPQGLTILHATVHMMNDAVQAIAFSQTVDVEEVRVYASDDSNSHPSSRPPSSLSGGVIDPHAQSHGRVGSMSHLAPVSSSHSHHSKTPSGSITKFGLESVTRSKPMTSDEEERQRLMESGHHSATPRIQNPFYKQKKVAFTNVPKKVTVGDDATGQMGPTAAELAAQAEAEFEAEIAALHASDDVGGSSTRPRSSFRSRPTSASNRLPATAPPIDDLAEATGIEDFLRIKRQRAERIKRQQQQENKHGKRKEEERKEQEKANQHQTQQPRAHGVGDSLSLGHGRSPSIEVAAITGAGVPPSVPASTLSLVVDSVRVPVPSTFRRVLRSRLLVADGMVGSEAKLMELTATHAGGGGGEGNSTTSGNDGNRSQSAVGTSIITSTMANGMMNGPNPRSSPPIVQQTIDLQLLKRLQLHCDPSTELPNCDDSTSCLHVIQHPLLSISCFLAGSSNGHVSLWSLTGEWLSELGQSTNKGWPIRRPTGFGETIQTLPLSPKYTSSNHLQTNKTNGKEDTTHHPHTNGVDHDGDDDDDIHSNDAWSDVDDSEHLTAEEERLLINMQSASLGFGSDDSSVNAILAAARKKKIMNDDAKRGLAYGAAFTGTAAPIEKKNTAAFGGGGLGGPDTTKPLEDNTNDEDGSNSRPSTARSERTRARHKRLLESPRRRYAQVFRPRSAIAASTKGGGMGVGGTAGVSGSLQPPERTFAEQHPFYVPETLRVGGLRSALFLNDSKLRQRKTPAETRADEEEQQRLRQRDRDILSDSNHDDTLDTDLNFFQLAPRDQAAHDALMASRKKSFFLDTFLSDPRNLLDPHGGIKDHAVARLAIKMGEIDAQTKRKNDHHHQRQDQHMRTPASTRPAHARRISVLAKAKENVFTRLSGSAQQPQQPHQPHSSHSARAPHRPRAPSSSSGGATPIRAHTPHATAAPSAVPPPTHQSARSSSSSTFVPHLGGATGLGQTIVPVHANPIAEEREWQKRTEEIRTHTR